MELRKSKISTMLLALLAAIVVALSGFGAPVTPKAYADGIGDSPSFALSDKSVAAGESVELELKVVNNPGILGATVVIAYDEGLTLKDIAAGEAFSALTMTKPGQYESGCKLHWDATSIDSRDVKDGTIATLSFNVASDAVNGDHVVEVKPDDNNGSDDVYNGDLDVITVAPAQCKVTVSGGADPAPALANVDVTIDGQGQVSGGGEREVGTDVTLVATPDGGWHFVGWYSGVDVVSESASYTFALTAATALTAKFEKDESPQPEQVTVTVNVDGDGTVSGAGTYGKGSSVTLVAATANDSDFDGWYVGDSKVSSSTSYDITPSSDITYTAKFKAKQTSGGAPSGGGASSGGTGGGGASSGGGGAAEPSQYELDAAAAANVTASIAKLPSVDAATLSDKAAIEKAETDYSALTTTQKAKVSATDKEKLDALVTKVADMECASTVENTINGLPGVDALALTDKASVEATDAAYAALTVAQKAYVTSAATDKLESLKAKIAELEKPADEPTTIEPGVTLGPTEPVITPITPENPTAPGEPAVTPAPAKKANTMKVTVSKKSVKAKDLKKAKKTFKAINVKNAQGKVSYKRVSGSKKLALSKKSGKITVKKGTKKGTYRMVVKVSAAGNASYASSDATKTIVVKVK